MQDVFYTTAIIKEITDSNSFKIIVDKSYTSAKRSMSLLLQPCPGDLVQCLVYGNNSVLITAILSSAEQEQTFSLLLPPDSSVICKQQLQISADKIKLNAQIIASNSKNFCEATEQLIEKNSSHTRIKSRSSEFEAGEITTKTDCLRERIHNLAMRHTGSNDHSVDKQCVTSTGRHKIYSAEETVIKGKKVNLN